MKIKRITALLLCMVMLVSLPAYAAEGDYKPTNTSIYFNSLVDFVVDNYNFDISKDEVLERTLTVLLNQDPKLLITFMKALFASFDAYSELYTADEWAQYTRALEQQTGGIGVSMEQAGKYVEVVSVIDGMPASAAGIMPGDKIVEVDGVNMENKTVMEMQVVVTGEIGTDVGIVILRGSERIPLTLTRAVLRQGSVSYVMFDDTTAYIYISSFNSTTSVEMGAVLDECRAKGVNRLLIDLRHNPGGYVYTAVETAQLLVPKGEIATLMYKTADEPEIYVSELEQTEFEIVTLVNEYTASAAELLASALQDSGASKLVGMQTYGKGIVQSAEGLYGSCVGKLTTGEYLTRNGESIHLKGIAPDYVVKNRELRLCDTSVEPMQYAAEYKAGDSGSGVLAVNRRLSVLKYLSGEINDQYNEKTAAAVEAFQGKCGLEATGVMDITTQLFLEDIASKTVVTVDNQYNEALKLFGINDPLELKEDVK